MCVWGGGKYEMWRVYLSLQTIMLRYLHVVCILVPLSNILWLLGWGDIIAI